MILPELSTARAAFIKMIGHKYMMYLKIIHYIILKWNGATPWNHAT